MATRDLAQIIDKETGDVNNLRDKKLADTTAQSGVTSTDAVRLTTTSGDEIQVTWESFGAAISQFFKASNKSTITSLFGELTENNVSSPGSINMANLASVLGVPSELTTSSSGSHGYFPNHCNDDTIDIDILDEGRVIAQWPKVHSTKGLPSLGWTANYYTIAVVETFGAGGLKIQRLTARETTSVNYKVFMRGHGGGNYGSWIDIT